MDELLDIYDKNGKKTGVIKKRGDRLQEGEFNFAIELWVINSSNEILIQKRAACRKVLPNIWGMTTGYIKSGEDTQSGCIREAKEEIDLEILKEDLNLICNLTHGNTMWDVFAVKKVMIYQEQFYKKKKLARLDGYLLMNLKK